MGKKGWSRLAGFLSACYILGAVGLLAAVCCYCYPGVRAFGQRLVIGSEDSPARAAFAVLTESLEEGTSIREAIVNSCEVLVGKEN